MRQPETAQRRATSSKTARQRRNSSSTRCAIYTRKSSEEGLEQDFNSLHAQREACEAYIRSQKHEGWAALSTHYDDGGLSGATMERSALQQLLADIQAGKVDIVVVYKVDRLTRSLADFAKIVEIFDASGVAFVSVTQQFNTTSSMGRLTLNVLLSFAQFEREVTGERIRDKIAASKQKGMWMGGTPPLGYDARDRTLVVNEAEAQTVRHIFARYLALGSVRALREELANDGITSKSWISRTGQRHGGQPLARGALYYLLNNRIYLGEIVHKDRHYPGQHAPIVSPEIWDQAQSLLASNTSDSKRGRPVKQPSLLTGLVYDAAGHRMSPTYTMKAGQRYPYYVSRPLITDGRAAARSGLRVPAVELERVAIERLCAFLCDGASLVDAVSTNALSAERQRRLIARGETLAMGWTNVSLDQQRQRLVSVLTRIEVAEDHVTLQLSRVGLIDMLDAGKHLHTTTSVADADGGETDVIVLTIAARLARIGQGTRLIVDATTQGKARPSAVLIKLIARAHILAQRLHDQDVPSIADLADGEGVSASYATRLLRLAWLAPDITLAILNGRQPPGLTADKLIRMGPLPIDWDGQRRALGFR